MIRSFRLVSEYLEEICRLHEDQIVFSEAGKSIEELMKERAEGLL